LEWVSNSTPGGRAVACRLWYPIAIAVMTLIIGAVFLRDRSRHLTIDD
jgi:hypothetical protein